MIAESWPPAALRLHVDGLELRLPDEDQLAALARLAAAGVHDPDVMPFVTAWTDGPPDVVARRVVQYHWQTRGSWTPERWSLDLVVLRDGEVLGTQGVAATDFGVLREVRTGSWLGRAHQGCGVGVRMRAAVLALAFGPLGARSATSTAFDDNPVSAAVSRRLGYRPDGELWSVRRGAAARELRSRLDAADWRPPWPVTVSGVSAADWAGPLAGTFGLITAAPR